MGAALAVQLACSLRPCRDAARPQAARTRVVMNGFGTDALKIEASQAEPYGATQVIDNPFADTPSPADPGVLRHWRAHHDNAPDSARAARDLARCSWPK